MKIECEKQQLLKALAVTEKIAGVNQTLPVLGCVLLTASENTLTFRSTNLELGVEVGVKAKVSEGGAVAIPAHIFYNTIQNTQDQTIVLETQKDALVVQSAHSNTHLNTQPVDDFPSLPRIEGGNTYTLKREAVMEGIQSVVYSASQSTIKPELSSVYVYGTDKKIYFVATDSFRLAEKAIQLKGKEGFDTTFLLPLRNAIEVVRILGQLGEDDVVATIADNQISFECEGVFITSRVIDGVFPDYKQIIPKEHVSEVVLLKQDLLNVFKKIHIFSDRFGQTTFEVNPKKKICTVYTHNANIGETSDSVDATVKGEAVTMNFNYRYIYDCLNAIHSDSITLFFTGIGKPLVIRGVSDESFLYLVMPMNK